MNDTNTAHSMDIKGDQPSTDASFSSVFNANAPAAHEPDMSWLEEALAEAAISDSSHMPAAPEDAIGRLIPSNPFAAGGARDYYGRPVERMGPFLEELLRFWERRPVWRFGQLICNLDRAYRATHNGADFFYLEEDEFLSFLGEYEVARGGVLRKTSKPEPAV